MKALIKSLFRDGDFRLVIVHISTSAHRQGPTFKWIEHLEG